MKVSPHDQHTPGWIEDRIGLPSASMFAEIVTTKGVPTTGDRCAKYMNELAGEILTGRPTVRFQNQKMRDAIRREPAARMFYEMVTGNDVQEVGLCWKDKEKRWGASPDGLIDPDGGFETKDAEPHIQIMRLNTHWKGMEHYQQCQGGMFICDRKWWDLQSYCEGMQSIIIRFQRDEVFIGKLENALEDFSLGLALTVKQIRE